MFLSSELRDELRLISENLGDNISTAIIQLMEAVREGKYPEVEDLKIQLDTLPTRIKGMFQELGNVFGTEANPVFYLEHAIQSHQEEMTKKILDRLDRVEANVDFVVAQHRTIPRGQCELMSQGKRPAFVHQDSQPDVRSDHSQQEQSETHGSSSDWEEQCQVQEQTIEFLKKRLEKQSQTQGSSSDLVERCQDQAQTIELLKRRLEENSEASLALAERYKQLSVEYVEVRGPIRVLLRIKPESADNELIDLSNRDEGNPFLPWTQLRVTTYNGLRKETKDFSFEKVFGKGESNAEIFEEVKDFAMTAALGRNSTIMGYGASGTGKSHTFLAQDGLVQNFIGFLFDVAELEQGKYAYEFEVSAVEIYLDKVYDLLQEPVGGEKIAVKFNASSTFPLEDHESAFALVNEAVARRQVSSTANNEVSSRSHCVVTLKVTKNPLTGTDEKPSSGIVNFVDLAGSESVAARMQPNSKPSQADIEGQDILKSLLDIGKAIRALGDGQPIYPVHSLTKYLRPGLSAGSRVLLVVTVSPLAEKESPTMATLLWSKEVIPARKSAPMARKTASSSRLAVSTPGGKGNAATPKGSSSTRSSSRPPSQNPAWGSPAGRKPAKVNATPAKKPAADGKK